MSFMHRAAASLGCVALVGLLTLTPAMAAPSPTVAAPLDADSALMRIPLPVSWGDTFFRSGPLPDEAGKWFKNPQELDAGYLCNAKGIFGTHPVVTDCRVAFRNTTSNSVQAAGMPTDSLSPAIASSVNNALNAISSKYPQPTRNLWDRYGWAAILLGLIALILMRELTRGSSARSRNEVSDETAAPASYWQDSENSYSSSDPYDLKHSAGVYSPSADADSPTSWDTGSTDPYRNADPYQPAAASGYGAATTTPYSSAGGGSSYGSTSSSTYGSASSTGNIPATSSYPTPAAAAAPAAASSSYSTAGGYRSSATGYGSTNSSYGSNGSSYGSAGSAYPTAGSYNSSSSSGYHTNPGSYSASTSPVVDPYSSASAGSAGSYRRSSASNYPSGGSYSAPNTSSVPPTSPYGTPAATPQQPATRNQPPANPWYAAPPQDGAGTRPTWPSNRPYQQ